MPSDFPLDLDTLNLVLDYLNVGVYITDRDRRVVLWNRKAEEITGHAAKDVVGRACHEEVLVHVDKHGHALCTTQLCPLHRSISTGKPSDEPLLVFAQRADRQRMAVSVNVAPLHDKNGEIIGGIEAFIDETRNVRDLEFARQIQQHLMPETMPSKEAVRFDVRYYPHNLIGGDFYDVRDLGDGRHGLFVADVRGHGVSAALYTMWLKSLGESQADHAGNAEEFVGAVNRELSRFVVDESFATAFYAIVDTASGRISYTNAGHPPPLHFHASDGNCTMLESHGMPLGIFEEGGYETGEIQLGPGDLMLCYTDGVTESSNKEGELLGEEGLAELLKKEIALGRAGLLERLYHKALDRCAAVSFFDDVLLLSVERAS